MRRIDTHNYSYDIGACTVEVINDVPFVVTASSIVACQNIAGANDTARAGN